VIFPNPTDGKFNLLTESDWNATIMDVTGKIFWSGRADTGVTEISLENPVPGIYFVRLTDKANETHVIRILVK